MNFPPTAWFIMAMGVLWLALRVWSRRAEERRAEAREARMAELYAERERLLGPDEPPSSLGAVVSDSAPPEAPGQRPGDTSGDARPMAERRCVGCRTVNAPGATLCSGCGLEL